MMKKALFVLFIIIALTIPKIALGITVSVSDASGTPGQKNVAVTIDVRGLNPKQKISGIDLCLDYNDKALLITKVSQGALTSEWNILSNMNQPGKAKIGLYSVKALTEKEGAILVVTFAVKDNVSSRVIPLRLSLANFNEKPAEKLINGKFSVTVQAKQKAKPSPKK